MSIHWSDGTNAIAATASAVAAIAAWFAAHRSNATAEAVAQIERNRWHTELTPEFEVTATQLGPGTNKASLRILLKKPPGLPGLTKAILRIRDDGYVHMPLGFVTQETIDATVYGPYRFEPGIDDASADGRTVTSRPIGLGDWDKFALERTLPGHVDRELWLRTYNNAPIRLSLECHAAGYKPWHVAYEVAVLDPSAPQT
jgi:hypothetical protein